MDVRQAVEQLRNVNQHSDPCEVWSKLSTLEAYEVEKAAYKIEYLPTPAEIEVRKAEARALFAEHELQCSCCGAYYLARRPSRGVSYCSRKCANLGRQKNLRQRAGGDL